MIRRRVRLCSIYYVGSRRVNSLSRDDRWPETSQISSARSPSRAYPLQRRLSVEFAASLFSAKTVSPVADTQVVGVASLLVRCDGLTHVSERIATVQQLG